MPFRRGLGAAIGRLGRAGRPARAVALALFAVAASTLGWLAAIGWLRVSVGSPGEDLARDAFSRAGLAAVAGIVAVAAVLALGLLLLRRGHAALLLSERRLQTAIDAHNVGIFEWDMEAGTVTWRPGDAGRMGLDEGAIRTFGDWARHVPGEDVARILETTAATTASGGGHFGFRYRFVRPDGEHRQIEGSAHILYDAGGRAVRAIGVNIDITERERDQAQLRSIWAAAPEAVIVIDAAGVVQRFSAAAERMFGLREEQMLGRNISALMPPDEAAAHDGHLARYRAGGSARVVGRSRQLVACRADGTRFPIELHVGEGIVAGERLFTGFVRDMTGQLAAEARVDALRAELIHADRLTAMGEVAAGLAHEINQPLAAASNYLSLAELTGADQPDAAAAALHDARNEVLRAGAIIRRLRDFLAKSDADVAVHELAPVVGDALSLALVGRDRSRLRIRQDVAPGARILADRVQVQQVLVNLVRNAADAIPADRGGTIEVNGRALGADMVEITVCDDGPGLSADVLDTLYRPFVTTRPGEGMGVGLSLSRRIVEAHGGTFTARNAPGGGACLHFTIPAAPHPVDCATEPS